MCDALVHIEMCLSKNDINNCVLLVNCIVVAVLWVLLLVVLCVLL